MLTGVTCSSDSRHWLCWWAQNSTACPRLISKVIRASSVLVLAQVCCILALRLDGQSAASCQGRVLAVAGGVSFNRPLGC